MNWDELLERVKDIPTTRVVVELHKPIISTAYPESLGICLACTPLSLNFYEAISYPCPTIKAIEEQLK